MKTKFNAILTLLLAFVVQLTFAQEKVVSGTVSDETGPLPGVNVIIKGTTKGAETDFDGHYTLKTKKGDILVFSFVGMEKVEKTVDKNTKINVILKASKANVLDEVVVVAYGTAKKQSFTGAVTAIKADKITKAQTTDVAKAIEGAVSGVVVSNSSGQPGQESTIRIRGIGSLNASSKPLIILDGSPYSGELSSINNNDIANVSVLKDAASAALYGARGANGVVIITTKKGKGKEASIKIETKVGINSRGVPEYDIMTSPKEYYETFWKSLYHQELYKKFDTAKGETAPTVDQAKAYANSKLYNVLGYNIYDVPNDQIVIDGKLNPNAKIKYKDADTFNKWADALFKKELRHQTDLSISKKTDAGSYYFSLGYLDDKGYNQNTFFDRYSSRLSYDGELLSWLKISSSSMFSKTSYNKTNSGSTYVNTFNWTKNIAPIYPIFKHDANGNIITKKNQNVYDFGLELGGVNQGRPYGGQTNPVATQNRNKTLYTNYYLTQSLKLDATLTKGLTFNTTASYYGNWFEVNEFYPAITPGDLEKGKGGESYKERSFSESLNLNQILRYETSFDQDYDFTALLGHESYKSKYNFINGGMTNLVDPKNEEWSNMAEKLDMDSYTRTYAIEGYFGQITGSYADKYFISGSYRRDASSIFHPDYRWGSFWSAGASWRVDKENFMRNLSFIDNLTLKASYGVQGNDNLLLPNDYRSYTPYKTLYKITADNNKPGLEPKFKGRKEVTWEKSGNFNTGIQLGLWKGLVNLEFDYFRKKTSDLLFNLPLPASTGFSSEPWNIGNMLNEGIEFTLNIRPINTKNLKWDISINGLSYKNTITTLPEQFKKDGITKGNRIWKEGGGIYDYYMVKWAGVNKENGDAMYWVKNKDTKKFEKKGSKDYDLGSSKQFIGTSIPDLQGGFSTSLNYKGFDLGLQFSYQLGGIIIDSQYSSLMNANKNGGNWHKDILKSWTAENPNTDIPRIEYGNNTIIQGSDRFVTDASYLALRNISLGYTFDSELLESIKIKGLRFYITADNVHIWSKRKGLDPRVSISGDLGKAAKYSPIRTISSGLVLTF